MRFVHTADWHLGRLFGGVSLIEEQAFALERLHEVLRDADADLLVIAGDVYDRAVPPPEAVSLFDDFLARTTAARIPVVVIAGNHDSPERLGFGSALFARADVHVTGHARADVTPVVLGDEHGRVHVLPLPYAEPVAVRELAASVLPRGSQHRGTGPTAGSAELAGEDGAVRDHDAALAWRLARARALVPEGERGLVVAHAFVSGGLASEDSERPLSVGGSGQVQAARFAPFAYAALGHLHRPQQVGVPHVRYSGALYPYSFAEAAHDQGVTLVTLGAPAAAGPSSTATAEHVPLRRKRSLRTLQGTLAALVAQGADDPARDDHVLAILDDEQTLLEPMARLRAVYPNVRDLRRAELRTDREVASLQSDHRQRATRDLFADFFREVTGAPLGREQDAALVALLDDLARRDREAS